MKSALTVMAALGLAALVGCGGGSTPGGPGVGTGKESKVKQVEDMVMQAENTFSLTVPTLSTKIKQGESKVVSIGMKRGKNFEQDVALKLDAVPQGLSVDPAAPVIKHGDTETKVTLKAAEDAAVGEFTVKVMGHPAKGQDAVHDLKVTVEKK